MMTTLLAIRQRPSTSAQAIRACVQHDQCHQLLLCTASVAIVAAVTSITQIINETLPALQQLKQQGLVRFIGITGLPFKALTYVLDRVPEGEQRLGAAVALCGELEGLYVLCKRGLCVDTVIANQCMPRGQQQAGCGWVGLYMTVRRPESSVDVPCLVVATMRTLNCIQRVACGAVLLQVVWMSRCRTAITA